jgi:hypothetical protein
MQGAEVYQYALWRVVPDIERGEAMNAGLILYCKRLKFLSAKIYLNKEKLSAIAPDCDPSGIEQQLLLRQQIAHANPQSGPISMLSDSQRFGWLVAPSSTIIQISPIHTGLCNHPGQTLDRLFKRLVE